MELNAMLRELADSPAPQSTVDIARAAAAGRRTVRLRRAMVAGSAALATIVVLGVLNLALANSSATPPVPPPAATTGPSPTTTAPPMPTSAPAAFDPLVQYAQVGWLPTGATHTDIIANRNWLAINAWYLGGPTSDGGQPELGSVSLVVVPSGHGVDSERADGYAIPVGDMPPGEAAPPVNGRPAVWVNLPYGGLGLRFEYAPSAWAIVSVRNVPTVDMKSAARQVAESVLFAVNTRLRLPYSTTAIPAELAPRVVRVSHYANSKWSTQAWYGTTDARPSSGDWPLEILAISRPEETGDGQTLGDPTTIVDGHPARMSNLLDGGSGLQLYNVDGVYLEMLTHSRAATQSLPNGSLVGLFRTMEIHSDPATWP